MSVFLYGMRRAYGMLTGKYLSCGLRPPTVPVSVVPPGQEREKKHMAPNE